MRTLSSLVVGSAADASRAAAHLESALARYGCAAWVEDTTLTVALDLNGPVPTQRMAAWRRLVTDELGALGIAVEADD